MFYNKESGRGDIDLPLKACEMFFLWFVQHGIGWMGDKGPRAAR